MWDIDAPTCATADGTAPSDLSPKAKGHLPLWGRSWKPGKYTPLVREIQVSDNVDLGSFKLRLYGDLNNNGQTDALDVLNLQLYIGSMAGSLGNLSGEDLTDARCSADVDLDGEVTALDVLNMQLFIGSHAGTMAQLP